MSSINKILLAVVETVNSVVPRRQRVIPSLFSDTQPRQAFPVVTTPQTSANALRVEGRWRPLRDAASAAYEKGLLLPTAAEISTRTEKSIIINTASADLSELVETNIIAQQLASESASDEAPQHFRWHQAIYQKTDHQAVLFCHPAYALAISDLPQMSLENLLGDLLTETEAIRVVDSFPQDDVAQHFSQTSVMLVRGQGLLTVGKSPTETVQRAEAANHLCQIAFLKMQVKP